MFHIGLLLLFQVTVLLTAGISHQLLTKQNGVVSSPNSYSRTSLGGQNAWTLSGQSKDSSGIKVKASVPGSQYTALFDNKLIPDPLYRDNDVTLAWVGNSSWTYSRDFSTSTPMKQGTRMLLVCEGLDTVANVTVNGRILGMNEDNMFRRYVYDVTSLVIPGHINHIDVHFRSTVTTAAQRALGAGYVIPPECPPDVQNGQCHVNQVRTEQCSFSWDWGPSMPTQGIWKPIYIETFSAAVLRDSSAIVVKTNNQWSVVIDASFNVSGPGRIVTGRLTVNIPELALTVAEDVTLVQDVHTSKKMVVLVPLSTPVELWWPNGYGKQKLYDVNVTFTAESDVTQRNMKVGFRTVELIQDPVSAQREHGLTFYFRINGLPIFLKGSNWIPADSFQERISKDRLYWLLSSASSVGINAMRVWGGGVYESDELYSICDELGIMVWQDLMFSVALYPSNEHFLASVAEEITYQIQRLKHHPSIILWAGNNENEKALRQDWFGIRDDFQRYYDDYVKLYVTTIKPIITELDSSREYLVSSPGDGAQSVQEGYVAKDPGSELYGDIHFYDYTADQWDASVFRVPRMASEYGVEAWCNNESLASVFAPEDFSTTSKMVAHRQHHGLGNIQMAAEVGMHMKRPTSVDEAQKFADFIYLTQINQAMSMRAQTEHYRRNQATLMPDGRGLTMGALYWQLNDIWQAPTWASIDYEGRWKMLHYFAKKFFTPTLVSPYLTKKVPFNTTFVDVFVVVDQIPSVEKRDVTTGGLSFSPITHVQDLLKTNVATADVFKIAAGVNKATSGNLVITMYTYANFTPLKTWNTPYTLTTTAESVYTRSSNELIKEANCPSLNDCFLTFETTSGTSPRVTTSSSWLLLTYPKDSNLQTANVKVTSVVQHAADPREFEVVVSAARPALFVWLSSGGVLGMFSDNGFLMHKSEAKVTFSSKNDVTVQHLTSVIAATSLNDIK